MNYNTVWTKGQLNTTVKQVIVAIDHGLMFPDIEGLEYPVQTLRRISDDKKVDGLIANIGIYRIAQSQKIDLSKKNRLLTIDWASLNSKGQMTQRELITSLEEAVIFHPDSFKMFFNVFSDKRELLNNIRDLTKAATTAVKQGISCLAEVVLWNTDPHANISEQMKLLYNGCRMALEAGADCLKIPRIGPADGINELIDKLELPTFFLGGSKVDDKEEFISSLIQLKSINVCGLMFGRNVWQNNMDEMTNLIYSALN